MKLSKVIVAIAATLAASALLPSAKGQYPTASLGMPTYTLKGIPIGTAPDKTQYKTALWIGTLPPAIGVIRKWQQLIQLPSLIR